MLTFNANHIWYMDYQGETSILIGEQYQAHKELYLSFVLVITIICDLW